MNELCRPVLIRHERDKLWKLSSCVRNAQNHSRSLGSSSSAVGADGCWDSRRTIKCVTNPKWKDNYGQLSRREALMCPQPMWDRKFETQRATRWHAAVSFTQILQDLTWISLKVNEVFTRPETKMLIHKFVEIRALFLWGTAAYPWLHIWCYTLASRGASLHS